MKTLESCKLHEKVRIAELKECEMKRRLLDLGFVVGSQVECVLESPSKLMRAYLVKGCKIALRNADSKQILVETEGEHAV